MILAFVESIGLPVVARAVRADGSEGAVPGLTIQRGALVIDPGGVPYPGDILHEAGHLALLPPSVRATASGRLDDVWGAGYELGALCWSAAAARHLDLDLRVVFHEHGYRGDGDGVAEIYNRGDAPGLPLLVWAGLSWAPGNEPPGEQPFPAMRRWLRVDEITA